MSRRGHLISILKIWQTISVFCCNCVTEYSLYFWERRNANRKYRSFSLYYCFAALIDLLVLNKLYQKETEDVDYFAYYLKFDKMANIYSILMCNIKQRLDFWSLMINFRLIQWVSESEVFIFEFNYLLNQKQLGIHNLHNRIWKVS